MKMIPVLLAGLVVFGAAVAGGIFVKASTAPVVEAEDDDEGDADLESSLLEPVDPTDVDQEQMPVAVRADSMSVEELLRFSLSVKDRDRLLKLKEEQFRQRQVQQQLVLADITAEQKAIDGLQAKLDSEVKTANELLNELTTLRDNVVRERELSKQNFKEIESQQIEINEQHQANDKKLSTWLQGMSAENAAAVLKEMANDGDMNIAVRLLANFEEREAAKILDSIEDPKLLNEFIAAFRNLKSANKSEKGRGKTRR